MSAIASIDPSQILSWQNGFLSVLPAVQAHAQIKFRYLSATLREEAIQEATAAAWVSYRRLAAQNKLHVCYPSTLANFAVKHFHNGRHVGGHQDAAKDVMSPVAQRRHRTRCENESDYGEEGWKNLVVADRRTSIPDLAAFRIDFAAWLTSMTRRDRRIIAALASGEGTQAAAQKFGLTPARISQLRRRFQKDWMTLQRQATDCAGEPT
jgi:hypothetical protein